MSSTYAWYTWSWFTRISSTKFLTQSKSTSAIPTLIWVGVTPTPTGFDGRRPVAVDDGEPVLAHAPPPPASVTRTTTATHASTERHNVRRSRRAAMHTPRSDLRQETLDRPRARVPSMASRSP